METAGAAVGIAALGIQVCQGLIDYYNAFATYEADISYTYAVIKDLSGTLTLIKTSLERDDLDQDRAEQVKNCLLSCQDALAGLEKQLSKLQKHKNPGGPKEKVQSLLQRSGYPFRKNTLEKLTGNVAEVQGRLVLALRTLQLDLQTTSQSLLVGLRAQTTAHESSLAQLAAQNHNIIIAQQADELKKIMAWLSAADPWTNHNSARERHEGSTGDWLLQSDQYKDWKLGVGNHIWMYGKAGCGKSVLCSTAVADIIEHCQHDPTMACAFFYFSFSDEHKQPDMDLLRSLVTQLCQRELGLSMLREVYGTGSRSALVRAELEKVLLASIGSCITVFLLLDALDECPEDDDNLRRILACVQKLAALAPNLKILATSRQLTLIRDSLDACNFTPLSIETSDVDADIKLHIS